MKCTVSIKSIYNRRKIPLLSVFYPSVETIPRQDTSIISFMLYMTSKNLIFSSQTHFQASNVCS